MKVSGFQLSDKMKVIISWKSAGYKRWRQKWVEKAWSQRAKSGIIKDNTAKFHNQKHSDAMVFFRVQFKSSLMSVKPNDGRENLRPHTWAQNQQLNSKNREQRWTEIGLAGFHGWWSQSGWIAVAAAGSLLWAWTSWNVSSKIRVSYWSFVWGT